MQKKLFYCFFGFLLMFFLPSLSTFAAEEDRIVLQEQARLDLQAFVAPYFQVTPVANRNYFHLLLYLQKNRHYDLPSGFNSFINDFSVPVAVFSSQAIVLDSFKPEGNYLSGFWVDTNGKNGPNLNHLNYQDSNADQWIYYLNMDGTVEVRP